MLILIHSCIHIITHTHTHTQKIVRNILTEVKSDDDATTG